MQEGEMMEHCEERRRLYETQELRELQFMVGELTLDQVKSARADVQLHLDSCEQCTRAEKLRKLKDKKQENLQQK